MNPNRGMAVVIAILTAILAVVIQVGRGPSQIPRTAPDDRFSADRAGATLRNILGGDVPHPVGTAAHDAVRDRIVAYVRGLGYETVVQQTFACNAHATCAPVANIVARLPGDARADTLVVSTHYDSVAAGPGASDDGIGVAAVLEVARALRHQRFRNSVLFVITDGEEAGLLGAEGFVADPAMSRGVAAAINVDNRGTYGRSYLFETSRQNLWIVRLIAPALPHPSASSLYYNLYELLPNDTDMTVFKRFGAAGINFACIGGVAHYHTPLDNLAHVTPSTLQDHGDHIQAATRALANADLRQSTAGDAVFFDIVGLGILWWTQVWTKWMAAGALLLLFLATAIHTRDGATSAGAITAGVLSFFFALITAAVFGSAAAWIASLRVSSAVWAAQPGPVIAAMWLTGVASAIVCARALMARSGFDGLFIGYGFCWAILGAVATILLPGGSYLFVVPAMAFALGTTLRATLEVAPAWVILVTSAITALLWFPIVLPLYDLMGRPTLAITAVTLAIISTTFAPLAAQAGWMRRPMVSTMAATAAACVGMQLLIPAYTTDSPRRINVRYVDDDEGARWQVDALTRPLQSAAHFTAAPPGLTPWFKRPSSGYTAAAPRLPLSPPTLRVLGDEHAGRRRLTLELRSTRGADAIALVFHAPNLAALRINGVAPPPQPPRFATPLADGWHAVNVIGAQQAEIEITLRRDEPIEAIIADRSTTLPGEGSPLLRARDTSNGVPSGEGDSVTVRRRVRL